MAIDERYHRQVTLLVRTLPIVAREKCFALKGGTAINLFVRDMPRLSVDIDLAYLPVNSRSESARDIRLSMSRIAENITRVIPGAVCTEVRDNEDQLTKLLVRAGGAQVMVEVTPVLRGCVKDPALRETSPRVQSEFGFAEMQVVSWADLYAGKIVAALDRQHPRDLFDVRDLLATEGLDDGLREAFLVYLLSHNKPMHAVLKPVRKEISTEFAQGFSGMTAEPVPLRALLETREILIEKIVRGMPDAHRDFLISFEQGEPEWDKLGVRHAHELPAVRWRIQNLEKAGATKRSELVRMLIKALEP
jgi:predicted nucleotidyltransferase component of viral defense system